VHSFIGKHLNRIWASLFSITFIRDGWGECEKQETESTNNQTSLFFSKVILLNSLKWLKFFFWVMLRKNSIHMANFLWGLSHACIWWIVAFIFYKKKIFIKLWTYAVQQSKGIEFNIRVVCIHLIVIWFVFVSTNKRQILFLHRFDFVCVYFRLWEKGEYGVV
jgi:hypothetical protein